MAIEVTKFFGAEEKEITLYNGQPLIDYSIEVVDTNNEEYPFNGYVSAYWRFYNERSGKIVKSLTSQLSRNANFIVVNASASDMTFKNRGKFYYEFGYVMTGGYEIPLGYSTAKVI